MNGAIQINKRTVIWNLLMVAFMIGGGILVPLLKDSEHELSTVYLVFTVVLAMGAAFYVLFFEARITDGFLFWLVPLVYVISVAFLLLFDQALIYPFWTFGGLLLLCGFKLRYGVLLNLFLLFVIGSMQTVLLSEVFVVQVVCLLLFGLTMPYVKEWKDAVNVLLSLAAVLVSVRIIFYLITSGEKPSGDIFCVAVVYLLVVCAVLLLAKFLRETEWFREQHESFDFLEELAASTEATEFDVSEYMTTDESEQDKNVQFAYDTTAFSGDTVTWDLLSEEHSTRLDELSQENAPLLVEFEQRFPRAFLHVRRVAIFAAEVADRMENVNVSLVKCAGYYHEIGRLKGKKSIENTVAVAEEENFPPSLVSVLREHTVEGEKPKSKEAALILLTDNVCGMCEHLRSTQKGTILVTKVIDRALSLRISKGDFSQSGLTAKDLFVIRNAMTDVIKGDMF